MFVQSVLQPKPLPPTRQYTLFLKDFDDQSSSSPALKRYCPESVDSFVTQWVEASSGSESYRERHCWSENFLGHLTDAYLSRRLTKSAPSIKATPDADQFVVSPTPASTGSRSSIQFDAASSAGGSSRPSEKSLIEDPEYRDYNLASNNIYMRSRRNQYPEHISDLVDLVRRDRDSPGPSADGVWQDEDIEDLARGVEESKVQRYFQNEIFPRPTDIVTRTERLPMARRAVPDAKSRYKVSNPVPDLLYEYKRNGAFPQQQAQLLSMGYEMIANDANLLYPFFVIEFKGDGPSGAGSLWVATNKCLGGSASCVNIAERLNDRLRLCKSNEIRSISSTAFSVAMTGTEARLYISWKHDELIYYMQVVRSFCLQEPADYIEFRKYVRNIIDWGKDGRLKEIQDSLNILLVESRRKSSSAAKSRPPPSESSHSSRDREFRVKLV